MASFRSSNSPAPIAGLGGSRRARGEAALELDALASRVGACGVDASEARADRVGEGGRERLGRDGDRMCGRSLLATAASQAMDVEMTPGIPHASMSSKSARSTSMLSAMP